MKENQHDAILRYLVGEMTPEERAHFERRLGEDEVLAREVESHRRAIDAGTEWFDADAPGAERVDSLVIPRLASASSPASADDATPTDRAKPAPARVARVVQFRPILVRALAAAAVFAAGILVGALVVGPSRTGLTDRSSDRTDLSDRAPLAPARTVLAPEQGTETAAGTEIAPRIVPPLSPASKSESPATREILEPARRIVRTAQNQGDRVIIETALADTGNSRAVWVVDGSFRLDGAERR